MAWLESHQSLRDHPKARRLGRQLGGLPAAIGHLHALWWWCLDYAPDGDLTKHSAEDIATAALWDGDPDALVNALVDCGFLDRTKRSLSIHDWADYGGKTITRREASAERKRRSRKAQSDVTRESRDGHAGVTPLHTDIHTYIQGGRFQRGDKSPEGVKRPLCPECEAELTIDEHGEHCPVCPWRPATTTKECVT